MTEAPVQTEFGWHIIRVDDERQLSFPAFEDVKPKIYESLQRQAVDEIIASCVPKPRLSRRGTWLSQKLWSTDPATGRNHAEPVSVDRRVLWRQAQRPGRSGRQCGRRVTPAPALIRR